MADLGRTARALLRAPLDWLEVAAWGGRAQPSEARVLEVLPALGTPTISALADDQWIAVNTVVEEQVVRELLPTLVERGARGIVEYPLAKIVG